MSDWIRKNLFKGWIDGFITVILVGLGAWFFARLIGWGFVRAVWDASTLVECQQIVVERHGADQLGACWAVFNGHIGKLLFGFYPEELYWRPVLAFFLLLVAMAPIFFASLPRKLIWFSAAYPAIAYILIWGVFGLEPVEFFQVGGFLITIIFSVAGVAVAITFGVLLALGRQFGILPTRVVCTAIMSVFSGIPIIVLLSSGFILLPYLLPPGFWIRMEFIIIVVLGMAAAAKVAEALRRELKTIPFGQHEDARALSLTANRTFWLVTLPHAYKRSIPQMAREAAELFQNTALVSLFGILGPFTLTRAILNGEQWNSIVWELYIGVALVYWIISFSIISYSKYYAQKLKQERHLKP